MATFNVNVIHSHDHTYQTYSLLTSVRKFSPAANTWLHGEITAVKTVLSDDGNIGVQTTYTVSYEDVDEEDLSHEEVAQKIRAYDFGMVGDISHEVDAQPDT